VQCMRKSTACAQQVHSPSIAPADAELGECARAGTAWALHEECECSVGMAAVRVRRGCTAAAVPQPTHRSGSVHVRALHEECVSCACVVRAWLQYERTEGSSS
jgi:hypothetical protein